MIVRSKNGETLVEIYPNESEDPRCFTGRNLEDGDLSALWLKRKFDFENPIEP